MTLGLLQKTCTEDASNSFLLWICSASHANFITIEPGKFDMAGHHLLWVWPHTRQCCLMTLRYNTVFRENAALWPRMALLGPVLSDPKRARHFDGGLESWFKIPDSLFLVNLTNLHLANQINILNCLPASELSGLIGVLVQASASTELTCCLNQESGFTQVELSCNYQQ